MRAKKQLKTLIRSLERTPLGAHGSLDSALDNSIDAVLRQLSEVSAEKLSAADRLSELLALPPDERGRLLVSNGSFQSYPLAVLVLKRSEQEITHNPTRVIELVRLARSIAARVDPRSCGGRSTLADFHAYALAMEGNALRVSGNMRRALTLFEAARQIQTDGGVDPDLTARIDRLESSLRRSLRQLDTTLALLDRAEEQFRAIRDEDEIARTIINRSNAFFVKGDFDRAENILEDALELARDPYLVFTIKHNTIDLLARSGRPQEASRLLEQSRSLYFDYAAPLTTCRQLWVQSIIIRESGGNLGRARELLMEATNRLMDHGYDTTTAGLELTVLRSREGLGDIRRTL